MNLLRILAEHDRLLEAPPELEGRLILAFRARKRRQKASRAVFLGVAAILAVAILLTSRRMGPTTRIAVGSHITAAPPRLPVEVSLPRSESVEPKSNVPPKQPGRIIARQPVLREVDTEFFPLVAAAPPFERGQIWRLEVPASAMRTVGLPVREEHLADRIQADVLVGEEGMVRAIRFVAFEVR
jgi:hypothetical protein